MFDLLFESGRKTMSSEAMDDLIFDELKYTVFAGEEKLYNNFVGVLSAPLIDRSAILKRQMILQDLLLSPRLVDQMCDICKKACEIQEEGRKNLYQKIDAKTRLRMNHRAVQEIFECVGEFGSVIGDCRFKSEAMNFVKDYFRQTDKFEKFSRGLTSLVSKVSGLAFFRGDVIFNELATFKSMTIGGFDTNDIIDKSENTKKSHVFQKILAWKNDNNAFGGIIDYSENGDIERQINRMAEEYTYAVCGILTQIYSYYKSLFQSLYKQLSFYRAAIKYLGYLKRNGLLYCFPDIVCESKVIEADKLYFLPLALKRSTIDSNDFDSQTDSVFVTTGYNRGGKTTFLRSIGFAQILAQAGLAVPAQSYKCSVFRYILVHFPRDEVKQLSDGLFEDEIKRLKCDTDSIDSRALVLMNESFSTTVESEAEMIASDIITALAMADSMVFFVTHFYRFAVNIDDLNRRLGGKVAAVNLITKTYEKANTRTNFQIARGDPIPNYRIKLEDFI